VEAVLTKSVRPFYRHLLGALVLFVASQVQGQTPSQQAPGDASTQREQVAPGVTGTRPPTDQKYATEPAGTKGYTTYLENLQTNAPATLLQDQVLTDPSSPYELVIPPTDQNYKSLSFFKDLTAEIMHSGEISGPVEGVAPKSGRQAFTNYLEVRLRGSTSTTITTVTGTPPGISPCELAVAYGLSPGPPNDCKPRSNQAEHGLIAIVGVFYNKTIANDLSAFSKAFGLPDCSSTSGCLQIVEVPGDTSSISEVDRCHWAQETALDVQWAHAMAPNAKLLVIEATKDDWNGMLSAAASAGQRVSAAGGGQVSISWTTNGEYQAETSDDRNFSVERVVFIVASGDYGGRVNYPASSPGVVAVGGTTLKLDSTGGFVGEEAWPQSDGGRSAFEPIPSYQVGVANADTLHRSVPDVAATAGLLPVWLTDTCSGEAQGWRLLTGTSFSAPIVSGMIHTAGRFATNSPQELINIYKNRNDRNRFRDITSGASSSGNKAQVGYDFVTGVGVPLGTDFDAP
jgi:kumamolisin